MPAFCKAICTVPGTAQRDDRPAPGPLKVLVAVGAPDEDQTPSTPLDLERELGVILRSVHSAARHENAQVKILEIGHPDEIARALKEDSFHVLHLSGHGGLGVIELEDEDGAAVVVTALRTHDSPGGTDRTDRTDRTDPSDHVRKASRDWSGMDAP